MAPTVKRTGEMKAKAESGPRNSITVAAGTPAGPERSPGRETESARSSPGEVAGPDDEGVRPSIPIHTGKDGEKDVMEGSNINGHTVAPAASQEAAGTTASGRDYYHEYEFSDLDEITVRQLNEDILAYRYDLEYCKSQLEEADLTPQEMRTLQLRTLDLGHQLRHCKHRIEIIKAQSRKRPSRAAHGNAGAVSYSTGSTTGPSARQHRADSGMLPARRVASTPSQAAGSSKRPAAGSADEESGGGVKRAKMASPDSDVAGPGTDDGSVNTSLQRLGFWKCRLCSAPKYLLAGSGRSPAAPCKWPLKDISKMITHFTEMHGEHTPSERCVELGAALSHNRGPFEYWLRRTRAQNISDSGVIDDCLETLLDGEMPDLLRRHSRAAASMPVD
ncbi:hypothetical protein MYCTH_108627 [Thermothelomyces thermophilus ATCC 42464]|uniref:Uncharacterized protein n=1 Tax=Thermothelomyces thermophilus (strain ATCC 42464 / BCRC 31852 / DSM 1799) TaxID=573729 RepID=G2QKC6_THET4|nr:uncharacterized protein MYCTH_108627 [Thermothelomyces thermophilus ATCC 42464]AEO60032.1 hypothetical protein MYCTH_108627 [Thermothelomyces thermophilus ATCC 42464]